MKKTIDVSNCGQVRLSEHFCLSEFIYSRVAIDNGIDNTPPPPVIEALRQLCVRLLEPLRARCGHSPMRVTSGYRCPELNKRVGGVSQSQHLTGEAADIYMADFRLLLCTLRSADAPEFDQAIYYPKRNFIHLSFSISRSNRRQMLCF